MSTALMESAALRTPATVIDRGGVQALSITAMQQRAELVIEAMANVLEEGKDYGKIPGTDKPSLYKPGAERLCMMFQLAPADPPIEDLSTGDEIRYRLHVPIVAPDGRVLAVGVGEASSNEEKYRWRRPVCDEEWAETDPAMRREKWFRGKTENYKGKQVRTSPADIANTVLKMAHKRALIHGTLLATAASSVFNQDLEDFTKELRESLVEGDDEPKPQARQPQRASASGGKGTAAAKPVPADAKVVVGHIAKVEEPAGKKFSVIKLRGDQRQFNVWNDSGAALIKEAKAFENTEHQVRLTYTEQVKDNKTFYNPISIAIADEPQASQAAQPSGGLPIGEPVKNAGDFSPFADNREPGSEG